MTHETERQLILKTFFAESAEGLESMEKAALGLEQRPQDRELLHQIFRVAHTLKGNALALGFPAIVTFAHALEDRLEPLRADGARARPEFITLLLGCIDALRDLLADAANGEARDRAHHRTLIDRLKNTAAAAAPVEPSAQTLRVDLAKLDRLLALSGEIAIARGRLRQSLGNHDAIEELDRHCRDLQEEILKMRAVPIGPGLQQHARAIRDGAAAQKKLARLAVSGEEVEVDTAVVELLRDPLSHLVRNALAHSIELPAERRAHGKPECGTVSINARHESGCVVIEVADDGRGFDRARIAQRALEGGFLADPAALSDEELFQVVFEPGFTTAAAVTNLSGRGVGMDVVRHNVERLRGTVTIASTAGKGATISLRLPLTLAIIDAFFVGAGTGTWAIPLESVIECIDLPQQAGATGVLGLRDQALPWLELGPHFGFESTAGARRSLVVVQHGRGRAGLVVDRLLGEAQTVLKPLSGLVGRVRGVAGSAILGDGQVALVLDVPSVLAQAVEAARTAAS